MNSVLDLLGWQVVLGVWLVGYIMGWASSIGVAFWLIHRHSKNVDKDEDE